MEIRCIQNFIRRLDARTIPRARLRRLQRGYSNQRIVEAFNSMLLPVEIHWQGKRSSFIVPYCTLALNIGLGHGLGLVEILYPATGYFADPKHTLDETYERTIT